MPIACFSLVHDREWRYLYLKGVIWITLEKPNIMIKPMVF